MQTGWLLRFIVCCVFILTFYVSGCVVTKPLETQHMDKLKLEVSVSTPSGDKWRSLPGDDAPILMGGFGNDKTTEAGSDPENGNDGEEPDEKQVPPKSTGPEKTVEVIDFKDITLSDVVKVFSELTGKNVVATRSAAKIKVTLFLKKVPWKDALNTLCMLYSLWYREDANIVRIMTVEEYARELTVPRDERTEICELKYASAMQTADTVAQVWGRRVQYVMPRESSIYDHIGWGSEGVGTTGRGATRRGAGRGRVTRYESTRGAVEQARELAKLRKEMTSKRIKELEEALKAKEKGEVERVVKEIEGESAVVYLTVSPRNNSIIAHSADQQMLSNVVSLIKKLDTPTTQILLKMKIFTADLSDGFESMLDFNWQETITDKHGTRTNTGEVGRFGSLPEGGTILHTFVDKKIKTRIELYAEQNRLKTIATPLILCANNAPAELFVGEERPITVNYESEIREFEGRTTETTRPVVELRKIGTKLRIVPVITKDKTVTMQLFLEVATVNLGGASASFITQAGEIKTLPIDTVDTSEMQNTIVAKDNQALALGGLVRTEEIHYEKKVPILGDIPLLSYLFSHKMIKEQRKELIILIEPHIMITPEEGQDISRRQEEVSQALERIENRRKQNETSPSQK